MTEALPDARQARGEMRRTFDRAFAAPVRTDKPVMRDLLAVRIGSEPYAIRLSEVTGLFVDSGSREFRRAIRRCWASPVFAAPSCPYMACSLCSDIREHSRHAGWLSPHRPRSRSLSTSSTAICGAGCSNFAAAVTRRHARPRARFHTQRGRHPPHSATAFHHRGHQPGGAGSAEIMKERRT